MKIIYKVSEDYMYEDVALVDDSGKEIGVINLQADCPEDHSVARLGIISTFKNIVKELTGKEIEVETLPYD